MTQNRTAFCLVSGFAGRFLAAVRKFPGILRIAFKLAASDVRPCHQRFQLELKERLCSIGRFPATFVRYVRRATVDNKTSAKKVPRWFCSTSVPNKPYHCTGLRGGQWGGSDGRLLRPPRNFAATS